MKPDFMDRIEKIIADVRTITYIDKIDAKAIEELLKDELNEYCSLLEQYYEEECYIAVSSARNIAYDDGHSDGYADGYDVGYDNGQSDCRS